MMVGRWVSFWDCRFLGAMLNFRGVLNEELKKKTESSKSHRVGMVKFLFLVVKWQTLQPTVLMVMMRWNFTLCFPVRSSIASFFVRDFGTSLPSLACTRLTSQKTSCQRTTASFSMILRRTATVVRMRLLWKENDEAWQAARALSWLSHSSSQTWRADRQSFGGNLQILQSNLGIHKLPGSQDAAQRGDAGRDEWWLVIVMVCVLNQVQLTRSWVIMSPCPAGALRKLVLRLAWRLSLLGGQVAAKGRGVCADKAPMVTKELKQAIMESIIQMQANKNKRACSLLMKSWLKLSESWKFWRSHQRVPHPKFNMEPNNVWFVDVYPFPRGYVQVPR